jgi:hypothetical protein
MSAEEGPFGKGFRNVLIGSKWLGKGINIEL